MKRLFYVALCLFVVLGCSRRPSPEAAYKKITEYTAQKDWGSLYDSFDVYSRSQIDLSLKMMASLASAFADDQSKREISSLTGKDLFMRMIENQGGGDFAYTPDYEILKTENKDNKAILNVKNSNGEFQEVVMLLENGEWKLHIDIEGKKEESNEALAWSALRSLSIAAETYATVNSGFYPKSINDLMSGNPPYLNTNYCNEDQSGYKYKCDFDEAGYTVTATPTTKGKTTVLKITTGGITTPDPQAKTLTMEERIKREKQLKLAEEARAMKREDIKLLKNSVTVALVEKGFQDADAMRRSYKDYITIKLVLANETDKDIKAVKGVLVFNDVFGDNILSVNFKYDEGIKAKSKSDWKGTIDYSRFNDSHQKLVTTSFENIVFDWKPQIIIFADGSKIGE